MAESILRADLLEQIPDLAAAAVESNVLKDVVSEYLIPLVARSVGLPDNAVDRAAQAALFQLIEAGYVSKFDAEIKICPSILALSNLDSTPDANTKAIPLMSKLGPHLGRDITERVFLERFTELCTSPIFFVRKMCADHFGHFCTAIGKEAFEESLLPCYIALCVDEVWGVRKACAEQITYMSCVCPPLLRKELLAPAFDRLLQDSNRWVRLAAFQSLGLFLSTFAETPITNVKCERGGGLVLVNNMGGEFVLTPAPTFIKTDRFATFMSQKDEYLESQDHFPDLVSYCGEYVFGGRVINPNFGYCEQQELTLEHQQNSNETISSKENNDNNNLDKVNSNNEDRIDDEDDDLHLFNSYNYWNIRLEPPLDPSIISGSECNPSELNGSADVGTNLENIYSKLTLDDTLSEGASNNTTNSTEKNDSINNDEQNCINTNKEPPQSIIPQYLVDHFISMTDPALATSIDTEMTYHCAYALPAVALTLGKENWHLLKGTIEALAGDIYYKVRRTVASGLHEIAKILGPELTTEDLTPIFDGFLKDLDEVRIGLLKHLAEFLMLIEEEKSNSYLVKLFDFVHTDNKSNWRFREELAKQLLEVVTLFKPCDTVKYIGFIATHLLCDKIAAVREAALTLVTHVVSCTSSNIIMKRRMLIKLTEMFAHSKQWKKRQTFCLVCIELLKAKALTQDQFASEIMPHLLDLSWDPVANVRLVVARCLSKHIMVDVYFKDPDNENCDGLETVLKRLQSDKDRDVRQSAEM
ncbi:unnamed protein product [Acanthoscelides obtectus]|uniref:Serine/threonine-protein phosphatase 4 regulatory subunit 1 n=1 Tax=Acanthoscelides obtectus TaxID=200917 RepID=A0A9P0KI40_ACAOB|nr:unnamed protein product [Acanthoscelides obtectus]CAK1647667.1 Serine/threonine-protein phosphatase 4 regulatory subunit 1 [Acanthoscelides obtectus]